MNIYKIIAATISLLAFNTSRENPISTTDLELWELGFTSEGVTVFYNIDNAIEDSAIQLKLYNSNSNPVIVNWDEVLSFYSDNIMNTENSNAKRYVLESGSNVDRIILRENMDQLLDNKSIRHLCFKNVSIEEF